MLFRSMTLNNSNIKIKSATDNDYYEGAIVLGYPDYDNADQVLVQFWNLKEKWF